MCPWWNEILLPLFHGVYSSNFLTTLDRSPTHPLEPERPTKLDKTAFLESSEDTTRTLWNSCKTSWEIESKVRKMPPLNSATRWRWQEREKVGTHILICGGVWGVHARWAQLLSLLEILAQMWVEIAEQIASIVPHLILSQVTQNEARLGSSLLSPSLHQVWGISLGIWGSRTHLEVLQGYFQFSAALGSKAVPQLKLLLDGSQIRSPLCKANAATPVLFLKFPFLHRYRTSEDHQNYGVNWENRTAFLTHHTYPRGLCLQHPFQGLASARLTLLGQSFHCSQQLP